jgi:hypothetical protein
MQPTKKIEESFDFSEEQLRPPSAFPQFLPPPVSSTPLFSFSYAPIRTDAPLT